MGRGRKRRKMEIKRKKEWIDERREKEVWKDDVERGRKNNRREEEGREEKGGS